MKLGSHFIYLPYLQIVCHVTTFLIKLKNGNIATLEIQASIKFSRLFLYDIS